jgi:hypothetical protein
MEKDQVAAFIEWVEEIYIDGPDEKMTAAELWPLAMQMLGIIKAQHMLLNRVPRE